MVVSSITHIEGNLTGEKGLKLYYQGWLPTGNPAAVIVVAHGLADHGGRYRNLVDRFVPRGYGVYAMDYRGHGKSEGYRGYVADFSDYVHDLRKFFDTVKKKHGGVPFFLFGHSMGGTVATCFAIEHQQYIKGLILSSPLIKPGKSVSRFHMALAPVLSCLVPRAGITPLDIKGLSHDQNVVSNYDKDPLVCHSGILARTGALLLRTMQGLPPLMPKIKVPLFILQGTADRLSNPDGSRLLFEKVSSDDKILKFYDGFYHELINEPGKEQVLGDIEQWLEAHIERNPESYI